MDGSSFFGYTTRMCEENTFYLQKYHGVTRGWETIKPDRYSWDIRVPPQAVFRDSCPATKALGSVARHNAGKFRVAVMIDGELRELVQAKGQAPVHRVQTGGRRKCCG